MERIIEVKFGIKIIERGAKHFIRFDEGEIMIKEVEYPITNEQLQKLLLNERSAYEVCLELQKKYKK